MDGTEEIIKIRNDDEKKKEEKKGEPLSKEAQALRRRTLGPWLHAFHDPVAGIKAFSNCVQLCDVDGNGEYKLLVADASKKLKLYKGTQLSSEYALLAVPTCLQAYISEKSPKIPLIAVACMDSAIYIYFGMKPYHKFTLPEVEISQVEQDVWKSFKNEPASIAAGIEKLTEARDINISLTPRSRHLLAILDQKEQEQFVKEECEKYTDGQLKETTIVACMAIIAKEAQIECSTSMLVVGLENNLILILDSVGMKILNQIALPSVPVFIAVTGTYDSEYRIIVACRNGNIYTIKKGKVIGSVIELETQICGLCIIEKSIIVGCMDNIIHTFHFKGKKIYSLYLDQPITNMEVLNLRRQKVKGLLVALGNGEVRLYNDKHLISTLRSLDVVTAMRFGQYGREETSLILCYRSGALTIKMLGRHAKLNVSSNPGPPVEQDIRLNVPKKTKLYLDQRRRERDQAIEMHRVFQRDLCKLRLSTARSYVKVITGGHGALSSIGTVSIRLDAKVLGLGPLFHLKLNIKNNGTPMTDVRVVFVYNHEIYRMDRPMEIIPVLIPNKEYQLECPVTCIDENGAAGSIRIFICSTTINVPLISAIVNLSMSEVRDQY